MCKIFPLITLFLLVTFHAAFSAVNPLSGSVINSSFTLEELGYKIDLTAQGLRPQLSILIPKFSTQALSTKAYLDLRFTPAISDSSTLTIRVNTVPLREETIKNLRANRILEIDLLKGDNTNQGYLIEISGLFSTANSELENAWVTVNLSSKVVYTLDTDTLPIFGRLINQEHRSIPVFVTSTDRATLETALEFVSAIGSYYYPWLITADFQPYPPINDGTPKVVIVDSDNPTAKNFQNAITMEEANQFINRMMLKNLSSQPAEKFLKPVSHFRKPIFDLKNEVSVNLAQLDIQTPTISGSGELSYSFIMNASDISARTYPSYFIINAEAQLPNHDKDSYVALKINGVLQQSFPISKGTNEYRFLLSPRDLREINIVQIFVIHPSQTENISFNIFPESRFLYRNNQGNKAIYLSDFPWSFTGNGVVVLSGFSPNYLTAAAKLLELQGRVHHFPANIYLKQGSQGLYNIDADYAIALLDGEDIEHIHPLIDTSRIFHLLNPLTKQTYFDTMKDRFDGFMQIFYSPLETPVLLLTDPTGPLLHFSNQLTLELFQSLHENVAILANHEWFAVPTGLHIRPYYDYFDRLNIFWEHYRLAICSILFVLVILFSIYVKKKLTYGEFSRDAA